MAISGTITREIPSASGFRVSIARTRSSSAHCAAKHSSAIIATVRPTATADNQESTWATVSILLLTGLAVVRPSLKGSIRAFVGQAIWIIAGYFVFLATIDVPMYFNRWRGDTAAGARYFSLGDGFRDAATRWIVTMRLEDWRWEMLWMSLYFSFGVWISVSLIRAPYPPSPSASPSVTPAPAPVTP